VKIAQMLLAQECKLILIACNSASAAAYELIKEYVGSKAMVVNVIDPVVKHLKAHHGHQKVGLIGTRQTVNSHIFKKKIDELNMGIQLFSQVTNLLASAIEEFGNHAVLDSLLSEYLNHPALQSSDALVLACTHYPIIKDRIAKHFKHRIKIVDTAEIVADAVKIKLEEQALLNASAGGQKHFYVSDYTESFANNAKLFFGEEVTLEHYPLWD
jgi:glutamate racemase